LIGGAGNRTFGDKVVVKHLAGFAARIVAGVETGIARPDGRRVGFISAGVVGDTRGRALIPYVHNKTLLATRIG
jgi:hypothetical protein